MRIKFNQLRSKKYFLLFILVMVINTLLTVSLLRVSFGQNNREDFSFQQPVKVEVIEQKDSPLRIVVINVDNSALSFQDIVVSLQNVSNKSVRAYTLLGESKGSGKIITGFFATRLLQADESETTDVPLERRGIKEGETVFLSIDYVEFEDGSSWGKDSRGKSKALAGQREGTKASIKELKALIKNQSVSNQDNAANFLKDLEGITVDVPNANQSDEWKRGFQLGYHSVISILRRIEEQRIEKITKKLDEMEKIAAKGGNIQ